MSRKNLMDWAPLGCVLLALLLLIAMSGCSMHVDLKTHAQEWETRRDRVALNQAIDQFEVKSLNQHRKEHEEYKAANKAIFANDQQSD